MAYFHLGKYHVPQGSILASALFNSFVFMNYLERDGNEIAKNTPATNF